MPKLSTATVAIIVAIALYFTLFWGYDSLRVLASPSYGMDDAWRSQYIFGIGRLFSLEPIGLIKLAAFFATLKLAVAAICAYHIVDRFRHMTRGQAELGDSGSRTDPGCSDQHRVRWPGSLVAKHRSNARTHDPALVCGACRGALHR